MDRGVDDMAGAVVFEVLDMVAVQNDDGGGGDDDSDDDNVDGCYYLDQVQDSRRKATKKMKFRSISL